MHFSEICIHRPVFAWVMSFILISLGVIAGFRLPIQQLPKMERPFVTIESSLSGASPEIMEAQVSRLIEDAMAGMEGVIAITSTSAVEDSKVAVEFAPGRSSDAAMTEIGERLRKIKIDLPQEMQDPKLIKSRAEDRAIMQLALTSDVLDPSEMSDYALRELQKEVESIPGVARAEVLGAGLYKMHLKLDPVKLAAFNITVTEVLQAIKQQQVERPAGKLLSDEREYLVTTLAKVETPEEFERFPITTKDGHVIHLYDIGKAEISADDKKSRARFNGKTGVSIAIYKQAIANPVEVSRKVKAMVPQIQERLPKDMFVHVGQDSTVFIEDSIKQVYKTIGEAILLVIAVVVLFLRSWRASIIPLVTIPVSLLGAFLLMYVLDFSINMLTLMSMVLAIGLVVDDAIVVLENIHRYVEEGMEPFQAAIKGIKEISFAIIAMTLTLAAVYAPISLSTGTIGKYFTEFALTLAGAVIVSGFAALTLSPMMCARMLKKHEYHGSVEESAPWYKKFEHNFKAGIWLNQIEAFYDQRMRQALARPWMPILVGLAFFAVGGLGYFSLHRELQPAQDSGGLLIDGQSSQSATLEYTDKYVKEIDALLDKYPEVERRITTINNPTYDVSIQLKSDRRRSTTEVMKELKEKLSQITGVDSKIRQVGAGSGDEANTIEFVIEGNKTHRELKEAADLMKTALYRQDFTANLFSISRPETEDFVVTVNRDKASAIGVEPSTIADTIETLVRGRKASSFKRENKVYDVMVEVMDKARKTPKDITDLFIKAGDKEQTLVPISELITVMSRSGPMEIFHQNRMRAIAYTVALKPGNGIGSVVEEVKKLGKDILPSDIRLEFTGETKKFLMESQNIIIVFGMALLFIYLVMAAQFESWIDPFIIMLSVPLALAGAVITMLAVPGVTLNIYSQIGLITLIGLITKHGILMVDFANKLREEKGLDKKEAILQASHLRLRPILMTTFAMVLGAIPLALATGSARETRQQLGWVIVGGMSFGTFFTLFVLPSIYYYLSRQRKAKMVEQAA